MLFLKNTFYSLTLTILIIKISTDDRILITNLSSIFSTFRQIIALLVKYKRRLA